MVNVEALTVSGLSVDAQTQDGEMGILKDVSMYVTPGEVVGIVGESGSGKSTLVRTIAGDLDKNCRVTKGNVSIGDQIVARTEFGAQPAGARHLGLILQSPMASLNPVLRIGTQYREVWRANFRERSNNGHSRGLLKRVGFKDPERVLKSFPHELSGGMAQRAAIGLALLCRPSLIIGDECTTALDVMLQARIVHDLARNAKENDVAVVLVTHDLALAAEVCERVYVMREGKVVESGALRDVLGSPRHAYTKALIEAVPSSVERRESFFRSAEGSSRRKYDCLDPAWCSRQKFRLGDGGTVTDEYGHSHLCTARDVGVPLDSASGVIGE